MHGHSDILDEVPWTHNGVSHAVARGLLGDGGGVLGLGGDGKSSSSSSSDSGLLGLSIPALPTPSLSLPGIPDVLGLTSSSSSSSSTTTASLTSSSQASSSSTTSSSTTSSSLSSSSSTSTSSTPAPTPTSSPIPDNTPAPAPAPTPTLTPTSSSDHSTSTIFRTIEPSAAAASSGAPLPPKSFMQNKPLCISVITIATLIGLVVLMVIATWAVRRRQRNKLHDEAAEFKTEDLVGGGHGHDDIEKGSQGMFSRADGDVINKVEMAAGARSVRRVPTNRSTGTTSTETFVNPANGQGYDPQKVGYGASQGYDMPKMYEDTPMAAPQVPGHPYYDGRDYVDLHRQATDTYQPAALDAVYVDNAQPAYRSTTPAYDYHTAQQPFPMRSPSPAQDAMNQYPQPRQLTPAPPPFLSIDVNVASAPMFGPNSALSFTDTPLQPADSVNPANPPPAILAEQPQTPLPRRSSLLNAPAAPVSPKTPADARKRSSSHSKALDPSIPPVPIAPPLPEEFGDPELRGDPRELKIMNA